LVRFRTKFVLPDPPPCCLIRLSLAWDGSDGEGDPLPPAQPGKIMPIRRYLDDHSAFDPEAIEAMSSALKRIPVILKHSLHA
jgi:hypothetical protein